MNYRNRDFLNLAYEFDCMLQIPGVCDGGTGEPCHANWSWAGKGGAMKASDVFAVPGCRKCHIALDQGSDLIKWERQGYWLRAFGKFLPALFARGLVSVSVQPLSQMTTETPTASRERPKKRKRGSQCTAASNAFPRSAARAAAVSSDIGALPIPMVWLTREEVEKLYGADADDGDEQ